MVSIRKMFDLTTYRGLARTASRKARTSAPWVASQSPDRSWDGYQGRQVRERQNIGEQAIDTTADSRSGTVAADQTAYGSLSVQACSLNRRSLLGDHAPR
jgi:hypothetical protein